MRLARTFAIANGELPRDDDGTLSAFAWPGGYPILYHDEDDETICPWCAQKSIDEYPEKGSPPVTWSIFLEGAAVRCAACGTECRSAYGLLT